MSAVNITAKGLAFGRYVKSLIVAKGDVMNALAYAEGQSWRDTPSVVSQLKASVAPLTTDSNDNGIDLTLGPVAWDFAEVLRPMTLIGRMQGLRRVPFNTRMVLATAGAGAAWVGEGHPIPAGAMALEDQGLLWNKIASLTVHTLELARSSAPSIELALTADVAKAAAYAADLALVDPTNAGVAGVKPTSITFGADVIDSAGSAVANVDTDLRAALKVLNDADIDLTTCYWLMAPHSAVYLSTLRGSGGAPAYPGMTAKGGTLLGIPVLTSSAVAYDANSPTETFIVLCAADAIAIADDGQSSVEVSTQGAIEMIDSPDADTGAESLVSLWQKNLVALKATRAITWKLRRSDAVAVIAQVQY